MLRQDEVPLVFREPNVFTGYRPAQKPWIYYCKSIFTSHNESMNVWTHITAIVISMKILVFDYFTQFDNPWYEDPHTWPFIAGYMTSVGLFVASVNAHLLHAKSELLHYVCFMFDYGAIGLYGLGTGMQHLYYCGEDWFFDSAKGFFLPVMCGLSCFSCLVSAFCKVRYNRPYPKIRKLAQVGSVAMMYAWIIFPLVSRFKHCLFGVHSGCEPALGLHAKQIVWFFLAGVFYGSDIPHKVP